MRTREDYERMRLQRMSSFFLSVTGLCYAEQEQQWRQPKQWVARHGGREAWRLCFAYAWACLTHTKDIIMGRIITDLSDRRARKRRIAQRDADLVECILRRGWRRPRGMVWPTPNYAALAEIIARAHAPAPRIKA